MFYRQSPHHFLSLAVYILGSLTGSFYIGVSLSTSDQSDCYTVNGRDYRGSVSQAGAEGTPCLYWNQTIQQRYNSQSDLSGELGLGEHNHCRNPDSDVQPWCYVSESEEGVYWKYCDIPSCHMPGYVGCFVDPGSPPALSGASGTSKRLTIQTCIQFCRRRGHQYAGVEAGYACFCGGSSEVDALQMVGSSQCDQVCFGRSSELCGGDGRISVYRAWVGSCHGNISSSAGVLYSPDFPDEYGPQLSCSWELRVPGAHALHIQFRSFHVSDPNDILEIKDGDNGNLLLQMRGGQDPPDMITFQTDHLQITFQSDRQLSGPGYVLLYRGLGVSGSSVAPYSGVTSSPNSSHVTGGSREPRRNVWLLLVAGLSLLLLGIGYLMWRYVARGAPDLWRCSMLYRNRKSGDLSSINQSSMKSLL